MIDYDSACAAKMRLGEEVANDPTCRDFMRQGRPLTNVEMDAFVAWSQDQIQRRIKRDGCCGGEMSMSGVCPETGRPCPVYLKAKRIERQTFHQEQRV
jgi:hypothetical protein